MISAFLTLYWRVRQRSLPHYWSWSRKIEKLNSLLSLELKVLYCAVKRGCVLSLEMNNVELSAQPLPSCVLGIKLLKHKASVFSSFVYLAALTLNGALGWNKEGVCERAWYSVWNSFLQMASWHSRESCHLCCWHPMRLPVQVVAAPWYGLGRSNREGSSVWAPVIHTGRSTRSSWLLVWAWPTPSLLCHLGSEPAEGRSHCLYLSL